MKRALVPLAVLLAACETTGPGPRDPGGFPAHIKSDDEIALERRVRADFEAWRDATIAGDFMGHYGGMTAQLVSDWLWRRVEDRNDTRIVTWLAGLTGEPRAKFDIWRKWNSDNKPERAALLPPEVLNTNWLTGCYQEYFKSEFESLKQQLTLAQVRQVAVDAQGATVVTSLLGQRSERWVMALCADGKYRVDGYIPPGMK